MGADTCTSPFFTIRIDSLQVLLYVTCIAISICHQNNHAAYGDIGIDNVAEDAIGNALEDVGSKGCADDDSTKSETVVCQDGRGKEAIIGTHKGHHHIANAERVTL